MSRNIGHDCDSPNCDRAGRTVTPDGVLCKPCSNRLYAALVGDGDE